MLLLLSRALKKIPFIFLYPEHATCREEYAAHVMLELRHTFQLGNLIVSEPAKPREVWKQVVLVCKYIVALSSGNDCVLDVCIRSCLALIVNKRSLRRQKGMFHKWYKGLLTRSLEDFNCWGKKQQCLEMLPDITGWLLQKRPAWYSFYVLTGHFELASADCFGLGFKSLLILQWTFNKAGLTLNQYLETLIKIKQEGPKDQMMHCGGGGGV